jgi:adenylate kinase family enzyme
MGKLENVVIAGKSGAGKQPRVDVLVKEFGLTQLGTGNIFREYLGALKKLERQPDPEQFWDAKADWFVDDGKIRVAIKADSSRAGVPIDDAVLGLTAARFVNRRRTRSRRGPWPAAHPSTKPWCAICPMAAFLLSSATLC